MALILLTNDDGIAAEGLRALEGCLAGLAELLIVAPDRERSAVSHGLTLRESLSVTRIDPRHFALNGTPADCIIYSLTQLVEKAPDMVVSGINHGANVGDDIMYSGTVAAAREASRHGIPSLAVSQEYDERPISFREGGRFIRLIVNALLAGNPRQGSCLNVNIPVGDIRGAKVTRQGCSYHLPPFDSIDVGASPVSSGGERGKSNLPTDYHTIKDRFISITPLKRDQTDYEASLPLREEISGFFQGRKVPRLGLKQ